MSSLYETPSEKAKRLSQSTSTGNPLQDIWTDYVSEGISLGEDGKVKREGAAWWFQGLTPGARSIAEQKKGLDEARTIDRLVQSSGLTEDEIKKASNGRKLTASNTSGIISAATRAFNDRITPQQQANIDRTNRIDSEATAARQDSTRLGYAQLESANNQFAFTAKENAAERSFTRRENNLNRTHERELADSRDSLQMQMAIMQNDLSEKRMDYDRETARMDKRDRMIAQLMSGLCSLGSAFG